MRWILEDSVKIKTDEVNKKRNNK